MSLEEQKALVRRYFDEVVNRGDFSGLDALFSPDYRGHHAGAGEGTLAARIRRRVEAVRAAFPDVVFTIEEQVAEGATVASRLTARGTHHGSYGDVPATGRQVEWRMATFHRFANGRIVDSWTSFDAAVVLHQLGALARTSPR